MALPAHEGLVLSSGLFCVRLLITQEESLAGEPCSSLVCSCARGAQEQQSVPLGPVWWVARTLDSVLVKDSVPTEIKFFVHMSVFL